MSKLKDYLINIEESKRLAAQADPTVTQYLSPVKQQRVEEITRMAYEAYLDND